MPGKELTPISGTEEEERIATSESAPSRGVSLADLLDESGGNGRCVQQAADFFGIGAHLLMIVEVHRGGDLADLRLEPVAFEETAVRVGSDAKTARDGESRSGEFAEVRPLAAHQGDIF